MAIAGKKKPDPIQTIMWPHQLRYWWDEKCV